MDRAFVVPPVGHIGPITAEQRQQLIANSLVAGVYEQTVDRESAFEKISSVQQAKQAEEAQAEAAAAAAKEEAAKAKAERAAARQPDSVWESIGKTAARSASSSIGRSLGTQIVRGVLGGLLGGKKSWF